jgi:glycosyltransferase involved in cell wall biosynthesis
MNLLVVSYKSVWPSEASPSGYATDGGFPFQMKALSELFDSTTLLVPCMEKRKPAGEGALSGRRLTIVPLTLPTGTDFKRKLRFPFWLLRNLPRLMREIARADAVHAPIPGDIGTIGMLLAYGLKKPLFIRYCGNWLVQATTAERFWRWFLELIAGGKNVCLATGGLPEPPSRRNAALKWIFATSLTREELHQYAKHRSDFDQRSPKLIIACRQEREKGTSEVIESLKALEEEFPAMTLEVVGDGGARANLEQQAVSLGLSNRVTFHGQVSHARVIELLQQADLFCFPTTSSEGFPKAVLEALACGLPVVTTRVSALPQLLENGCGVLLEEATVAATAAAITCCFSDRARYQQMSRQALLTAERYSLERWRDLIGESLEEAWGPLRNHA